MVNKKSMEKYLTGFILTIFTFALLLLTSACQNESVVESTSGLTQNEALKKLVEEDEAIQSFEPNFNESETMDFLAKTNELIYPVRIWQRIDRKEHTLDLTQVGDTVYGVSTHTFSGILFIAASYDEFTPGDSAVVDTVIEKPFVSVVTRNIIFKKVADTGERRRDWDIIAISLPEGGTGSTNIFINKLTVTLPNGEVLEITSPNDYYFSRNPQDRRGNRGNDGPGGRREDIGNGGNDNRGGNNGRGRMDGPRDGFNADFVSQFPQIEAGEPALLTVELESAYADTDHVAVTFGAGKFGRHRVKNRLQLVSSVPNGSMYSKVYEGEFRPRTFVGFFHAVVNAIPYHVIHDDSTPVEKVSWGVPYLVQ